jgi:uncharacterized protein YbcV (DUF1398 family)
MFTLQQIKTAHANVKSGSDFPRYIREIKTLGLKSYTFNVTDGSTTYYGNNGQRLSAPSIYAPKQINLHPSSDALRNIIAIHQQGKTDFPTFCDQAAAAGVKEWMIDTERMLCIYRDADGKEMVSEPIPLI